MEPIVGDETVAGAPASDEEGDLASALEFLEVAKRKLDVIDEAIAALAEGTFGRCEICGDAVEIEALRDQLDARRCAAHAR